MALVKLFGDNLTSKSGSVATSSLQKPGTVVGIYFSAHWCPPCRGFTPKLAEFYEYMKKTEKGADFEVVFVSSDKGQGEFDDYFSTMPWKALPFAQRDLKVMYFYTERYIKLFFLTLDLSFKF